jgi:hypothetical protein
MMFNGGLIKRSATLLYHLIQFRCQVGSYFSFSNSREPFPHRWSEGVAAVPSPSLCQPSITWSGLIEKLTRLELESEAVGGALAITGMSLRDWASQRAGRAAGLHRRDPQVLTINHRSEQAIGRFRIQARAMRSIQSWAGLQAALASPT